MNRPPGDLIAYMKRMCAAATTHRIPDGKGEWIVSVEWKLTGKVN
jgi:hypothetical protein